MPAYRFTFGACTAEEQHPSDEAALERARDLADSQAEVYLRGVAVLVQRLELGEPPRPIGGAAPTG